MGRGGGRRGCDDGSRGDGGQIRAHGAHEVGDGAQGGVVTQVDAFLHRNRKGFAYGGEGFGLFHRVDAQIRFQIQVEIQHILRVAGFGGDQGEDAGGDGVGGRRRLADCLIGGLNRGCRRWDGDNGRHRRYRLRYWCCHSRHWFGRRWRCGSDNRRGDGCRLGRGRHDGRRGRLYRRQGNGRLGMVDEGGWLGRCCAAQRADGWALAIGPAAGLGHAARDAGGHNAQGTLDDFQLRLVVAADGGHPSLVEAGIVGAVQAAGDAADQRHRHL